MVPCDVPSGGFRMSFCGRPATVFKLNFAIISFCANCDRKEYYNAIIGFRLPKSLSTEIIKELEVISIMNQ